MRPIVVKSPKEKGTVNINPLHLVSWAQIGELGTVYMLSTDNPDAPIHTTPTPASDITEQFKSTFTDEIARLNHGVR